MDGSWIFELNGIDGDVVDFPGHTTLEFLHEVQRKLGKDRVRFEDLKDRIIILLTWVEFTRD